MGAGTAAVEDTQEGNSLEGVELHRGAVEAVPGNTLLEEVGHPDSTLLEEEGRSLGAEPGSCMEVDSSLVEADEVAGAEGVAGTEEVAGSTSPEGAGH